MSVARDGTGALSYVKTVGGAAHVFVSRLLGGRFGPAQQVDAGLPGDSSQPVVAAANGGLALVAFVNGGQLYVASAPNASTGIAPPTAIVAGASNPSLAISPSGKGFLTYTATAATPHQVGYAYYAAGQWSNESAALDSSGGAAGDNGNRSSVAACGDGIGVATWGASGHVYVRRLTPSGPSTQTLTADAPSVDGFDEVAASTPAVSCVGYSTYAAIAFDEQVASGTQRQTRVLLSRLAAETLSPGIPVDGANPGSADSAGQPAVAITEYGAGWVTSSTSATHQVIGTPLGRSIAPSPPMRIDSLPNGVAPDPAPQVAGLVSTFIAWQQSPGAAGPADVRLRDAPNGADLGPEQAISDPGFGPTDADSGLVDGGDLSGDAAVAWVQDAPGGPAIVVGQLSQAPGSFAPDLPFRYVRNPTPKLSWSTPMELWGPVTYTLNVAGAPPIATGATATRTPPLAQGRHVWKVTATNQAGQSNAARQASVFVDTLPPRLSLTLPRRSRVRARTRLRVRSADRVQAGLPRSSASGVKRLVVRWGDRGVSRLSEPKAIRHVYRRRGFFKVTVSTYDRAGNRTTYFKHVRVRAAAGKRPATTEHTTRRRHRRASA